MKSLRHIACLAVLLAALSFTTGCSVKLQHGPLKSSACRGSGTVNLNSRAAGASDVIGFGTFTAFFIPVAPVSIAGDANAEVMLQVKDALQHAGYGVRFVDSPAGRADSGKVLHCRVTDASFHNYTYFFPIVPTWGTLKTELTLVSDGRIIWAKKFSGGGFTLNFFNGFTSCVRSSMTKNLDGMVAAFSSPEFRAALNGGRCY
jgi:hypothetical protein